MILLVIIYLIHWSFSGSVSNSVTSSGVHMGNSVQYFIFITLIIKNSASHRYKMEATLNIFI